MRDDQIDDALRRAVFDFFYKFSRFEFALKENDFWKNRKRGKIMTVEPDWKKFVNEKSIELRATPEIEKLIALNPKQQIVAKDGQLEWRPVKIDPLCKLTSAVCMLRVVRNNLFHGGKHGADGWDDPERTKVLVTVGAQVLDQLAKLGLEQDYGGKY